MKVEYLKNNIGIIKLEAEDETDVTIIERIWKEGVLLARINNIIYINYKPSQKI